MSGVGGRARGIAAVLVLAPLVVGVPPAVLAADVSFAAPRATATYGKSIDFSVDVTTSAPLARVELRLRFPDTIGPYIVEVQAPSGTGTLPLRYSLDLTGDGHLVPNTTIVATWAAYPSIGATPVTSRNETVRYQDTTHEWKTLKGELVVLHWYEGSSSFAKQELDVGERAVRETSALLGVTETDPVDFFIYGDQASFSDALGPSTRENVIGQARAEIRTMFGLVTPDTLDDPQVGATVYHELVHLVFDTAVRNPYRFPPHWLNEGLAVYLSEGYSQERRSLVEGAVRSKDLIPLDALGGQFPADATKGFLAYCEAVSAIDYLVRTDGRAALISLVKSYKEGLTDGEAFSRATGGDLAAFEAGWLSELGADAPTRYGPRPAPPGPLPSGWSGQVASPVPGQPSAGTVTGPSATPAASGGSGQATGDTGGDSTVVLLLVVLVVAGIVVAGLVLARRRGGAA